MGGIFSFYFYLLHFQLTNTVQLNDGRLIKRLINQINDFISCTNSSSNSSVMWCGVPLIDGKMWNNSLVVVVLLTSTFFLGIKGKTSLSPCCSNMLSKLLYFQEIIKCCQKWNSLCARVPMIYHIHMVCVVQY